MKTLAYDLYTLYPASARPIICENLKVPRMRNIPPTITVYREQFIKFANNYTILSEFVGQVLEKTDFTLLDILNWYHKNEKAPKS